MRHLKSTDHNSAHVNVSGLAEASEATEQGHLSKSTSTLELIGYLYFGSIWHTDHKIGLHIRSVLTSPRSRPEYECGPCYRMY